MIRKFNEMKDLDQARQNFIKKIQDRIAKKPNVKDLREDCSLYLAYLLDDNRFKLKIHENYDSIVVELTCSEIFEWIDIRDFYIPFVKSLLNKYKLHKEVYFHECRLRQTELENIRINNIINNLPMKGISLFVDQLI